MLKCCVTEIQIYLDCVDNNNQHNYPGNHLKIDVCVRACVCACERTCMRVCVCVCVCVCDLESTITAFHTFICL